MVRDLGPRADDEEREEGPHRGATQRAEHGEERRVVGGVGAGAAEMLRAELLLVVSRRCCGVGAEDAEQ